MRRPHLNERAKVIAALGGKERALWASSDALAVRWAGGATVEVAPSSKEAGFKLHFAGLEVPYMRKASMMAALPLVCNSVELILDRRHRPFQLGFLRARGLDDIICHALFHALASGTLKVSLVNQVMSEATSDLGGLRVAYKQWLDKQLPAYSGGRGTRVGHPNAKRGVAEAGCGSEFSSRLSRCILQELTALSPGFSSGVGYIYTKHFSVEHSSR